MTLPDALERWLASAAAEAPYVLSASRSEQLEEVAALLSQRRELEILALSTEKPTIAIASVRELFASLSATTLLARRLVIIPGAERLSEPAAAALLKHLEEPTVSTRYLLTTLFPQRLLPTILSRCQRLRLVTAAGAAGDGTADDVHQLAGTLEKRLRERGPSAELRIAFRRLRDYYQIRALRGNEKLAKEVLVASSPPDEA
jgi:DNA polymerase III delta prime subunit